MNLKINQLVTTVQKTKILTAKKNDQFVDPLN